MNRVGALTLLALASCKPTIIETPEPEPPPLVVGPVVDPLVEQEAVREAVRGYTQALALRDAGAAAALVVAETFVFYDDLRLAALRWSREQLEPWDLLRVLMVLQIRATVPAAELELVDGRGLFELAVTQQLVGEGAAGVSLDEVWIADDGSSAQIRVGNEPIVWLREVDGRWQIDLPEMIELLGPAIEAQTSPQALAEGKVRAAYMLLQLSSDMAIDFEIVDGPLEQIPKKN